MPACFLECVENKDEGKSYKWRRATGGQGGMEDDRTVRLPEGNFTVLNPDNFLCINFTKSAFLIYRNLSPLESAFQGDTLFIYLFALLWIM